MMKAISCIVLPALLLALAACAEDTPPRAGTNLGGQPVPEFTLTDAGGQRITQSTYRGRPQVVMFVYTACPDVCPLMAQRLGEALTRIGTGAERIAVLAVSVDPEGDTPEAAMAFLRAHRLAGPGRHYLLGDREALAPVWLAFGIGSDRIAPGSSGASAGPVAHTDAMILIDRDGRRRTLLRGDATAAQIEPALRSLLR